MTSCLKVTSCLKLSGLLHFCEINKCFRSKLTHFDHGIISQNATPFRFYKLYGPVLTKPLPRNCLVNWRIPRQMRWISRN